MKIAIASKQNNNLPALRRRAFTLVELLLVLTILAILAGIVLPKFGGITQGAKTKATLTQISAFKTALNLYEVEQGGYPKGKNGLNDLVIKPTSAKSTWHKYLDGDKVPLDQWDRPYVYECPGRHNPDSFDIYSLGPDGKGGNDSIGNWTSN